MSNLANVTTEQEQIECDKCITPIEADISYHKASNKNDHKPTKLSTNSSSIFGNLKNYIKKRFNIKKKYLTNDKVERYSVQSINKSNINDTGHNNNHTRIITYDTQFQGKNYTKDVPSNIDDICDEHRAAYTELSSLNKQQVENLQASWELVKQHIERIGVVTFLDIFEQHSDFRDAFAEYRLTNFTDVKHDASMQVHGLRVLNVMDKLISRLPNMDYSEKQVYQIGGKHCRYIPSISLIPSVADQLWEAIEPVLKDQNVWNDDVIRSWRMVLDYLTKTVRYGLSKTIHENKQS